MVDQMADRMGIYVKSEQRACREDSGNDGRCEAPEKTS